MTMNKANENEINSVRTIFFSKTKLLMFQKYGTPNFYYFFFSDDPISLIWEDKRKNIKKTQINISNIKEIYMGQRTSVFTKAKRPDLAGVSFSILYYKDKKKKNESNIKTLDIVCKDKTEYYDWITTMNTLVNKNVDLKNLRRTSGRRGSVFTKFRIENSGANNKLSIRNTALNYRSRVSSISIAKSKTSEVQNKKLQDTNDIIAFGDNGWGQLCLGHNNSPQNIPELSKPLLGIGIKSLSCGWNHTSILLSSNKVIQFGNRLGIGNVQDCLSAYPIIFPPDVIIMEVSCGENHSAAIDDNGKAYTWGSNFFGQLGLGKCIYQEQPTEVKGVGCVISVCCGSNYTAFLTIEGTIYTCGFGKFGVLGHGSSDNEDTPKLVEKIKDINIVGISGGDEHLIGMEYNGNDIYVWGWNGSGQLGTNDLKNRYVPQKIILTGFGKIIKIKCGAAHSSAIVELNNEKTSLYVWGSNKFGQLGLNRSYEKITKPKLITFLNNPRELDCGANHTGVVTEDQNVYLAGCNLMNQLGVENQNNSDDGKVNICVYKFQMIRSLVCKDVRGISCGGNFTILLTRRKWIDDSDASHCMGKFSENCKKVFTIVNRRHHCRNCGGIFCSACSSKTIAILNVDYKQKVRVCTKCYTKISISQRANI